MCIFVVRGLRVCSRCVGIRARMCMCICLLFRAHACEFNLAIACAMYYTLFCLCHTLISITTLKMICLSLFAFFFNANLSSLIVSGLSKLPTLESVL